VSSVREKTEAEAVQYVAERYKRQYCLRGEWARYGSWKIQPSLIYEQLKRLSSLSAADVLIGNGSWTRRIPGWRNKNRAE
jgi:hypothetical protein